MDSGASISVLNLPTYLMIAKMYNITTSDPLDSSKTLMIANQSELPIKHYITVTCHTSISKNSRHFTIPFAVADIKYNILGTPFFEEHIANINVQDFTMKFKNPHKDHSQIDSFTTLTEKNFPLFFIYLSNYFKKANFCFT